MRPGPAYIGRGPIPRVRRGSEGLEVRTGAAWSLEIEDQVAVDDWVRQSHRSPPWLEDGRYNVYDPGLAGDNDSGDDS